LFGPQPGGDELLVLACREVDEPVDTPADTDDAPAANVVHEELHEYPAAAALLAP